MPGAPRALDYNPSDTIFFDDGALHMLDQAALPGLTIYLELTTPSEVIEAINRLAVRGAMAIGVAGAYGVLLGAMAARGPGPEGPAAAARQAIEDIGASRPTARNLFWALERMEQALAESEEASDEAPALIERLHARADEIALDTIETNRMLVEAGQKVISDGASVLTHCNSGPLAALRYGTALGVLIEAHRRGRGIHVYVDETRPLMQGSRLTAWELGNAGVPYTLIPDSAAAFLMSQGRVDAVMTGADRIAANGDCANKIGTYGVAVLARAHGVPFYIAAPGSTVDLACASGSDIVIEERDPNEVRGCGGQPTAPRGAAVYNPAFDVTPAELVGAIVTEKGVLRPPYLESLKVFPGARPVLE
jgi:methylthioribose-1-phosphate isomerase